MNLDFGYILVGCIVTIIGLFFGKLKIDRIQGPAANTVHFSRQIMLLEKIQRQLTCEITQRIIYALGLTLWIFIMWDKITEFPYSTSSLGLSYMSLFTFPALLLTIQIIRNNKVLWGLIFGLLTTYILVTLYRVISAAIERSGNHVKAIDWEIKDVLLLLITFGILFIVAWTIYMIRPKRLF